MPRREEPPDVEGLRRQIQEFFQHARRPILRDAAGEILAVAPGCLRLEPRAQHLLLEAWDDSRSLVQRVVGLKPAGDHELSLLVQGFAGTQSRLTLRDTRQEPAALDRDLARQHFRERFRLLLARTFPGWRIERLAAERDLRRTLSEKFVRASLRQGQSRWAAIGVSANEGEPTAAQILTDGLLWLEHLRRQEPASPVVTGLLLFLPSGLETVTANRIPFLDARRAVYRLFVFSRDGVAREIDRADLGNLRTELGPPHRTVAVSPQVREQLAPLAAWPGVEEVVTPEGELSLRYRGLEVARVCGDTVLAGKFPLEEVTRIRAADSPARQHPCYTRAPERWIEWLLKQDLNALALDLLPSPVYAQTVTVAGPARGVIDLLAVNRQGRLVVIEIKAEEDPQLPLQALDYWIHVRWHLERGAFAARGYFPGIALSPDPPLLWLVFPSIRLHASTDLILKYVAPAAPVSRLGINENWREGIRVVFRG